MELPVAGPGFRGAPRQPTSRHRQDPLLPSAPRGDPQMELQGGPEREAADVVQGPAPSETTLPTVCMPMAANPEAARRKRAVARCRAAVA